MNLIEEFVQSAAAAAARVEVIPSESRFLNESLSHLIQNEKSVLLSLSNELGPKLFSKFRLESRVIAEPSKEQLKSTRVGITDAFCGVASTGSVCVSVSRSFAVPISMLTRSHIVIIDSKTIVPRPRDIFSTHFLGGKGLHRSFSFITGPSATADMGQLVRGVHGPGELHVIVLAA